MLCYNDEAVGNDSENSIVGVDDVEGPPVPIPNTEVKLNRAEDTWWATTRKNRKMPTQKTVPDEQSFFFVSKMIPVSKSVLTGIIFMYGKSSSNLRL